MSLKNKVVWSQGLFVQPHHFQQQTRYVESLVNDRCNQLQAFDWGVSELRLDEDLLAQGKFGILRASGRFPDGTPFSIGEGDAKPSIRSIPEMQNVEVFLCLPLRRLGGVEIDLNDAEEGLAREVATEIEVRDTIGGSSGTAQMYVAKQNLRFMLEHENRTQFTTLGIARIVERRPDGQIVLDTDYVPATLSVHAVPKLKRHLEELISLLQHRAEALAHRVSDGKTGAAEVSDFLFLQTINRYLPVLQHLTISSTLHPEQMYRMFIQIAGELATFTRPGRRPAAIAEYNQDKLSETFKGLLMELRQGLSVVLEQNVVQLPVQARKFGVFVAPIADPSLVRHAHFVLAAKASIADEAIRKQLPSQVKIGPVEKIRDLVNLQLPGIGFKPMPAAPRQLPYHAGFTYFELDRSSELWPSLSNSGGFAFHVGGDFPNLELQLWAIKG